MSFSVRQLISSSEREGKEVQDFQNLRVWTKAHQLTLDLFFVI